jgi:hypothetical protein
VSDDQVADIWLALVVARASAVCDCRECLTATIDRPPVELRRTNRAPRRWLHGRELARFYAAEDEAAARRHDIFTRLKQDVQAATGGRIQRGSEIAPPARRPDPESDSPSEIQ